MLFNSLEFPIFFAVVFLLYWFVFQHNLKLQNLLIVVASYVFYGWWDWRFLGLIILSTICDYSLGLMISQTNYLRRKKTLLYVSLFVNLGILGFFKYFNFFIDSFVNLFSFGGYSIESWTINVILPVGISFYTFQTLSYTIDIYRGKLKPTKDIIQFMAYVCFFPQLVAGPIERATNLLPQFNQKRTFDYLLAKDGLRQIIWGLSKKLLIADLCAPVVDLIFNNYENLPSSTLFLGAVFFAFQIYGDFSGYSDVAIGSSKLLGIRLMKNFDYPYFSRDIGEFWRRWHISLSTWFRDYLYIPLGGSRVHSNYLKFRNVMIIFIVSGFWHGANWTFIIWGVLNALYFLPSFVMKRNRRYLNTVAENNWLPSLKEFFQIIKTFCLICITWIFFRAESVGHALEYLKEMFSPLALFEFPNLRILECGFYITILLIIEWIQRNKDHGLVIEAIPLLIRWLIYFLLTYQIINAVLGGNQEFIYFQF